MTRHANQRQAPALIAKCEPFTAAALSGQRGGAPLSGRLPQQYLKAFAHACGAPDFYVVLSYATPIAWHADGLWYVPDIRYSATTVKHQGRLHLAEPRMSGEGWRSNSQLPQGD